MQKGNTGTHFIKRGNQRVLHIPHSQCMHLFQEYSKRQNKAAPLMDDGYLLPKPPQNK